MKKLSGAVVALAVAAAACGSATGDRINPELPGWVSRPSGDLHVLFRRELTIDTRKSGEDYERGRPEIDVANARVFIGSSDRGLYALRAFNGSTIWRFETLGRVQSEPLYDGQLDVVYFGSQDGSMYAVQASDGKLLWRYNTGNEVSKKPVVFGELLLFTNGADQMFCVDRRTGVKKWEVHQTSALGMEIGGHSGPAVDRGLAYVAYSDGNVGCYDIRDGAEKWLADLSAEAEQSGAPDAQRYLDVDTTPIITEVGDLGRVVFAASYAGGVMALDAESGGRVWANPQARGVHELVLWTEAAHAPHPMGNDRGGPTVPTQRTLFAASSTTGLWALELKDGKPKWRLPIPEGGITAPVPVAGAIAMGTTRYGLFLLSPRDGSVIDGLNLETGFAVTPAAYGTRIFAMTSGGTFLGLGIDAPLGRRDGKM